jgi:hypothetical protein
MCLNIKLGNCLLQQKLDFGAFLVHICNVIDDLVL